MTIVKNTFFAFALSAVIALSISLPVAVRADGTATSGSSSDASPSLSSHDIDKLNARLREQVRQGGTLPDLSSLPKPALPNKPLHVTYLVDTNKQGQVVRVRAGKPSSSDALNFLTYYNAMQTFIRTTSDHATAGIFELDYDYSPVTKMVTRDVKLVQAGGVDPNALGAVIVMEHESAAAQAKAHK